MCAANASFSARTPAFDPESLLGIVHWWHTLGVGLRVQHLQLARGYTVRNINACRRYAAAVASVKDEWDDDGGGGAASLETPSDPHEAVEELLRLHRALTLNSATKAALSRLRIRAGDLSRASSELMNLQEVLAEAAVKRDGRFGCRSANKAVVVTPPSSSSSAHKSSKHVCPHCRRCFTGRQSLGCHIRKYHETERGFMCAYCGEVFGMRKYLEEHEAKVHAGEDEEDGDMDAAAATTPPARPHACQECGRAFSRRNRLREHIECVHEQVRRRFACAATVEVEDEEGNSVEAPCPAAFNSRWLLRQHEAVVHRGEKKYLCPVCGKRFGYVHHVRSHLRHKHRVRAADVKKIRPEKVEGETKKQQPQRQQQQQPPQQQQLKQEEDVTVEENRIT